MDTNAILVWRKGFCPNYSTAALAALAEALAANSECVIHDATTEPPALEACLNWPLKAACLVVAGPWLAGEVRTVSEAESKFAELCFAADKAMGEPAACRHPISVCDDGPRDLARRMFLVEVLRELEGRECVPDAVVLPAAVA